MSLCFLSLETSKVFNGLILKNLEENGFDGLSDALIILFPYLDEFDNISAAQLSKKVGYTRQAMHKNIKKLQEYDYVTIKAENKKEKTILLTKKSKKLIAQANYFISEIENEISKTIGKNELLLYKKNQQSIYNYLKSKE
ncbi:MAG: winged helix DNA-binding protein [Thiovulaceae bacterium]|nr:winged helix DNA-binding protein [Sulfurimonadaceae bacterium]MCW9026557.1 winged helix DNA-binding protein [Sulfurimonadaceae bacterium]